MRNFPNTFKIGSALIALGAVLFMTGFFLPYTEQNMPSALTDSEIMEQAAGLGMVLPGAASNDVQSQVNLPLSEYAAILTDEEIMQRAYGLGMIFEDHNEDTGYRPGSGEAGHIVILTGANASDVAWMLEEAGIIDNASAFSAYIMAQDMARYINSGEYYIEAGLSHSAILRIISTTYRIRSGG